MNDSAWMPHGFCFLWQPFVLWASILADAIIALAYLAIPAFLIWALRHVQMPRVLHNTIVGFALFVFCCALTHVMDIVVIWHPWYYLDVAAKSVAAIVSIVVAGTLWRNRTSLAPYFKAPIDLGTVWHWPRLTIIQIFAVFFIFSTLNVAFLDRRNQELCETGARRATIDRQYNQDLLKAEVLYLSAEPKPNTAIDRIRIQVHRIRIAAYEQRAQQSINLQICVPHLQSSFFP